jgi:hypothetical protein
MDSRVNRRLKAQGLGTALVAFLLVTLAWFALSAVSFGLGGGALVKTKRVEIASRGDQVTTTEFMTPDEVGNAFGGVSSLFSALSLAGVVMALLYQRKDLDLTLDELRRASQDQRRALAIQALHEIQSILHINEVTEREIYNYPDDYQQWSMEQRHNADVVAVAYNRVGYYCICEFISYGLVLDERARTIYWLWQKLEGFVRSLRADVGEPTYLEDILRTPAQTPGKVSRQQPAALPEHSHGLAPYEGEPPYGMVIRRMHFEILAKEALERYPDVIKYRPWL